MTAETSSPYAVGVAAFDLTPAPGRLWGRMRGLAVVIEGSASPLALVALDGVRVPPGFGAGVAELLGWPAETVVIWPGGNAQTDVSVAAVAEAIQEARAQEEAGHCRVAVGPAWGLRSAVSDGLFLVGQRLERSHRQLRSRASDERLEALVTRLHHAPPPPGTPWGHLLVDQRVALVEAVAADGRILGAIGWLPGTDPFSGGAWCSAGLRGEVARRLGDVLGDATVPVVVVGPDAPGLLGVTRRPPGGPAQAREQAEQGAEAVVRAVGRVRATAERIEARGIWGMTRVYAAPGAADGEPPLDIAVTRIGPVAVVCAPGRLTDGIGLRIRDALGVEPVLWMGPVGGDVGVVATPRESNHAEGLGVANTAPGGWLVDQLAELGAPAAGIALPVATPHEGAEHLEDVVPEVPTPHLMATLRRGRERRRGGARTFELSVRFRARDIEPPGNRWQLCLEWERRGEWSVARVRGRPVDDLHQGMRTVVQEEHSGGVVQVRWTVPEHPRWAGRKFRVRVGPAWGGPFVSAPFKVK